MKLLKTRLFEGATVKTLALAIAVCCVVGTGWAAPQDGTPEPTGRAPGDVASSPPRSNDEGPVRERSVYIPFDKLEEVFEREGRGIFLPYDEFLALWERAHASEPENPNDDPPAAVVIRSGAYTAEVEGELVRFVGRFNIVSLVDGWSTLAFPLTGVALDDVAISDDDALLSPSAAGYELMLPGKGDYELTVRFSARVEREPGKKLFRFRIPAAAVSSLELQIAEENVRVDVEPAVAATHTVPQTGGTQVMAFLGNSGSVQVTWYPPAGQSGDAGSIVAAEQRIQIGVEERILRVNTHVHYSVQRGEVDTFEVEVPTGMQVVAVIGSNFKRWQETDAGTVKVELHAAVKDRYVLELRFQRILDETPASLPVPLPRVRDVLRETGWVTLAYDSGLDLRVSETTNLSQLDPDEIPQALRQAGALGFYYLAQPVTLAVTLEIITPEVRSNTVSVITLGKEVDRWVGWIDYDIRRAGLFRLAVQIPAGWDVDVIGDPQRIEGHQTTEAAGLQTVSVSLRTKAVGAFRLPFRFVREGTAVAGEQTLQPPRVVGVLQDQGYLGVSAPRAFDVVTTDRQSVLDADADELHRSGIMGQVGADAGLPRAFRYRQQPASVKLQFAAKKTEIEVLSQVLVEVADGEVRATFLLDYNVLYAGVESIRFTAPASLDERLQVEAKQKTQVSRVSTNAGVSVWEVRFQPPLLGPRTVTVTHTTELPALQSGAPHVVDVPLVRATDVRIEQGFVAIRKEGTLEIAPTASGMESIEAVDLPDKLRRGQIYGAFRYFTPEPALSLQLTRFDYERLATTAVSLLKLRALLTEERRLSAQAILFVQNSDRQYLEIRFPPENRILSLLVNGQPQSPKKRPQHSSTLIEIPTSAGAGGTFPIVIDYEQPLGGGSLGSFGTVELHTPEFIDDVPVAKIELDLYLPPEYGYISWGGNLHRRNDPGSGLWQRFRSLAGIVADDAPRRSSGRFTDPPGIRFDLPTEDHRVYRLDALSSPGTAHFRYLSWPLFWFFAFSLFVAGLIATTLIWRRMPTEHRVLGSAGAFLLAATLTWFAEPPASVLGSALTAGVALAIAFIGSGYLRERWQSYRATRRALAADPYLEEVGAESKDVDPSAESAGLADESDSAAAMDSDNPAADGDSSDAGEEKQ